MAFKVVQTEDCYKTFTVWALENTQVYFLKDIQKHLSIFSQGSLKLPGQKLALNHLLPGWEVESWEKGKYNWETMGNQD